MMAGAKAARMPLLDHLREFRKRIVRSVSAILLAALIGWFFYNEIIAKLAEPVCDLALAQRTGSDTCGSLYISGVLGPLNLQIKVALLTGLIMAAPLHSLLPELSSATQFFLWRSRFYSASRQMHLTTWLNSMII